MQRIINEIRALIEETNAFPNDGYVVAVGAGYAVYDEGNSGWSIKDQPTSVLSKNDAFDLVDDIMVSHGLELVNIELAKDYKQDRIIKLSKALKHLS